MPEKMSKNAEIPAEAASAPVTSRLSLTPTSASPGTIKDERMTQ
jgi:hypothetical protein